MKTSQHEHKLSGSIRIISFVYFGAAYTEQGAVDSVSVRSSRGLDEI